MPLHTLALPNKWRPWRASAHAALRTAHWLRTTATPRLSAPRRGHWLCAAPGKYRHAAERMRAKSDELLALARADPAALAALSDDALAGDADANIDDEADADNFGGGGSGGGGAERRRIRRGNGRRRADSVSESEAASSDVADGDSDGAVRARHRHRGAAQGRGNARRGAAVAATGRVPPPSRFALQVRAAILSCRNRPDCPSSTMHDYRGYPT
jgi:hypothetical protein